MLATRTKVIRERVTPLQAQPWSGPPGGSGVSPGVSHAPLPSVRQPWGFALALVFLLWIIAFFGPDFWLTAHGIALGRRVPIYLYALLAGLVLLRAPAPSKAT